MGYKWVKRFFKLTLLLSIFAGVTSMISSSSAITGGSHEVFLKQKGKLILNQYKSYMSLKRLHLMMRFISPKKSFINLQDFHDFHFLLCWYFQILSMNYDSTISCQWFFIARCISHAVRKSCSCIIFCSEITFAYLNPTVHIGGGGERKCDFWKKQPYYSLDSAKLSTISKVGAIKIFSYCTAH